MIFIKGRVEAFFPGGQLNRPTAVIHVEKANPEIPLVEKFCIRPAGNETRREGADGGRMLDPSSFRVTRVGELAIGMVNHKTTAVRLIPVPGKDVGEKAVFGGLSERPPSWRSGTSTGLRTSYDSGAGSPLRSPA